MTILKSFALSPLVIPEPTRKSAPCQFARVGGALFCLPSIRQFRQDSLNRENYQHSKAAHRCRHGIVVCGFMFARAATDRPPGLRRRDRSVAREATRKSHQRKRLALVDWIVLAERGPEFFRQRRKQRHCHTESPFTRGRVCAGEWRGYVSYAACEDVHR